MSVMWGFFPFVQENKKKMYPTERLRNRILVFFSVLNVFWMKSFDSIRSGMDDTGRRNPLKYSILQVWMGKLKMTKGYELLILLELFICIMVKLFTALNG